MTILGKHRAAAQYAYCSKPFLLDYWFFKMFEYPYIMFSHPTTYRNCDNMTPLWTKSEMAVGLSIRLRCFLAENQRSSTWFSWLLFWVLKIREEACLLRCSEKVTSTKADVWGGYHARSEIQGLLCVTYL